MAFLSTVSSENGVQSCLRELGRVTCLAGSQKSRFSRESRKVISYKWNLWVVLTVS